MSSESDEPTVASLASALMRTMLHELVTDIAIEEHRLAWRRRTSMQANEAQAQANAAERLLGANGESSSSSSGAATASTSNLSPHKKDDALYECMICGRQIGAPRFASHLSSCMGLTGRSKRAATNKAPINGKLRQVLLTRSTHRDGTPVAALRHPPTSFASSQLGSDRASSYASDEDSLSGTEKRNGTKASSNGLKRSASLSGFNGTSKHKKAKTSSNTIASRQCTASTDRIDRFSSSRQDALGTRGSSDTKARLRNNCVISIETIKYQTRALPFKTPSFSLSNKIQIPRTEETSDTFVEKALQEHGSARIGQRGRLARRKYQNCKPGNINTTKYFSISEERFSSEQNAEHTAEDRAASFGASLVLRSARR
ncbi:BZ3500_MvSof-1268-A1-R1_Chr5-2g07732 [Microbotryum saponariae]|uniref:SAGA-associated factor 11 n=1 Tax=Microbotryum saponariae TaxID=289078 RepID=A0A2X0LFA0_9BASI|nr:BZ3500_MvSof-1268-A1-R1_Chr5-2g07732 [Microbotryum saponariae]SDA05601.1 BZ3501_MvSof-1269-A2-R1_Chr5-2g07554 [Microbotryum saponariae]